MATRTIANGGGAWTTNGTWVEGTAPTSADDVVATATSGNVTVGTGAVCRSADFTGYVGVLTHTSSVDWAIGDASGGTLKFVAGMTYTPGNNAARILFQTTTNANVTLAGKTCGNLRFGGGAAASITLQDTVNCADFAHSQGTLNTNAQTINCQSVTSNSGLTRTLTLTNSAVNVSSGGAALTLTTTNNTVTVTGSTITLTGASVTFAGGGRAYATVTFTGTGTHVITGANTFTTLTASNAAAITLTLPASTTTTATSVVVDSARAGLQNTLLSSTGGTAATLSVASGTVAFNHCAIKDITATGGATFQAADSVSTSGNTNITFLQGKIF